MLNTRATAADVGKAVFEGRVTKEEAGEFLVERSVRRHQSRLRKDAARKRQVEAAESIG